VYVGATVAVLIGLEVVLLLWRSTEPQYLGILLAFPAAAAVYLASGLVAWARRPTNRVGPLMVLGALTWVGAGLANVDVPALIGVGLIVATVPVAVVMHLLLSFPSGRLHTAAERVTVSALYVAAIFLQAPNYLFGQGPQPACPALAIDDRPDIASAAGWVQDGIAALAAIAAIVLLAQRHRAASPAQRRVLGPLYVYGIVVWLFVPISARVLPDLVGVPWMALAQIAVLAGVPLTVAVAAGRGGFARTGAIDDVSAWRALRSGGPPELARIVGRALGDQTVELEVATDPTPGPDRARATFEVQLDGRRVGALRYDALMLSEPADLRAAARAVAVALDYERLTTELTRSQDGLRRSRTRIAQAADDERRRIARDLHDGLQGRLVALGIDAALLAGDPALDGRARAAASELRDGLRGAIGVLGALVQGLMPAALLERGLAAAVQDLADRMPLPVKVDLDERREQRPPPAVELTAYFLVAEALANALKHARPTRLDVSIARVDDVLRVAVGDDGTGGAVAREGGGLRGIADRVDVLGGQLSVVSPRGAGTHVLAELPCAS
jgi:signal transduction histidine kinase